MASPAFLSHLVLLALGALASADLPVTSPVCKFATSQELCPGNCDTSNEVAPAPLEAQPPALMTPLQVIEAREAAMLRMDAAKHALSAKRRQAKATSTSTAAAAVAARATTPADLTFPDGCDPNLQIKAHNVYVRGSTTDGYDAARMLQYAQYLGTHADASAKLRPAVLVGCTDETHVQSAVKFASQCGYAVTVRSGGHSYTGASSCNGKNCLQLDLGAMNATAVVKGTNLVTSGPGINLLDFAKFTVKHFLSVPHGGCSKVGMGGHFQSSAWGMMTQSHGSGLDHVSSFRMVMADGSVRVVSRNDDNTTLYKSVLGSAPGSWGIITEYTLDAVSDVTLPFVQSIIIVMEYSRDSFVKALKQTQFIASDQERRYKRDLKVLLVTAPPTEGPESGDDKVYIHLFAIWTGIDSGPLTKFWRDLYLQPFYDLPHKGFPGTVDMPMTLSLATRLFANMWTNHDDRYMIQAYHSDRWWSDDFIEVLATEVDERVAMLPEVYPSFQYMPVGHQTTWARNSDMNVLTWRDVRACKFVGGPGVLGGPNFD